MKKSDDSSETDSQREELERLRDELLDLILEREEFYLSGTRNLHPEKTSIMKELRLEEVREHLEYVKLRDQLTYLQGKISAGERIAEEEVESYLSSSARDLMDRYEKLRMSLEREKFPDEEYTELRRLYKLFLSRELSYKPDTEILKVEKSLIDKARQYFIDSDLKKMQLLVNAAERIKWSDKTLLNSLSERKNEIQILKAEISSENEFPQMKKDPERGKTRHISEDEQKELRELTDKYKEAATFYRDTLERKLKEYSHKKES